MSSDQLQMSKAGNLGDVLKHTCLLALLQTFGRTPGRLLYCESHAFRPETMLVGTTPEQWREAVDQIPPGYWRDVYESMEEPAIKQGRYLCSTGLASRVLAGRDVETQYLLCEKASDSRAHLSKHFDGRSARIIEDNHALSAELQGDAGKFDAVLALIDPYRVDPNELNDWLSALGRTARADVPGMPVVALAFGWKFKQWPTSSGSLRLWATIDKGPFDLALYANGAGAGPILRVLAALGWQLHLFDRYIMVDYSGASDPQDQRRAIAVADSQTPEQVRQGMTRDEVRKWLVTELREATANSQRVLFGFDHQFSWPVGLLSLVTEQPADWRTTLGHLVTGTYGGPPLQHPQVFCSQFNQWCQTTYGCSPFYSPQQRYNLPAQAPRPWNVPSWRVTEEAIRMRGFRPFPATEIGSRGAVGGQTICGMAQLHALWDDLATENLPAAFWPFEGLSVLDDAFAGKHVGVEIFPTLYRARGVPVSDAYDAAVSTRFASSADLSGELAQLMNLSSVAPANAELVRREGWILGASPVTAIANPQPAVAVNPDSGIETEADPPNPIILDEQQAAIVQCDDPVVRVIARAGTGKTTTMVRRAARVLAEDSSAAVLMLTFTRNAAEKMALDFSRLATGLDDRLHATTFHGFALRCLLSFGQKVSIGKDLQIDLSRVRLLNEFDRLSVFQFLEQTALAEQKLALKKSWPDKLSSQINSADPGDRDPADLLAPDDDIGRVWSSVLALYAKESLMDFDVVMVLFEYLLRTRRDFKTHARGRLTHFIIDEFQDTNIPQLVSLQHLTGYTGSDLPTAGQVMVVGDDFQSIYGWRGAIPGVFEAFAAWVESPVKTLPLRTSRRSAKDVLRVVNAVGHRLAGEPEHRNLAAQVSSALELGRPELQGGLISLDRFYDCTHAIHLLAHLGIPPNKIAVLSFKNSTASSARDTLAAAGIPCDLITARPNEAPGVRRFLAHLAAWQLHGDRHLAVWWFLATTYAKCLPAAFTALWDLTASNSAEDNHATLVGLFPEHPGIAALHAELASHRSSPSLAQMEQFFHLLAQSDPKIASEQQACLRIARACLAESTAFHEDPLRAISEMTRKDFGGGDSLRAGDAVKISTIHQFKGLEAEAVVLNYDFQPTEDVDCLRLDYVARSRAARWLCVLHPPASVQADFEVD